MKSAAYSTLSIKFDIQIHRRNLKVIMTDSKYVHCLPAENYMRMVGLNSIRFAQKVSQELMISFCNSFTVLHILITYNDLP